MKVVIRNKLHQSLMKRYMLVEKIRKYLYEITPKLNERFESRERLLQLSREVIRYCGEAISLTHRLKREEAKEKLKIAIQKLTQINEIIKKYPELLYGDIGTAYQEVSEALFVMQVIFGEDINLPEELEIPEIWYILGIADGIGELRRRVLELLKLNKLNEAERVYNIMEEIYEELWKLEYPKSLVPNLRQKIDTLRRIIEETNHDIYLAKITLHNSL